MRFICPLAILVTLGSAAGAHAQTADPIQLIDALKETFGEHPGQRKSHPKGFCAAGDFVPAADAKQLSVSPLFATARVPVVARLSLGGGNPKAPDAARSARGLAVQFRLPGRQVINSATLSVPVFAARDPETFRDLLRASAPDPATGKPDAARIATYRDAHPDTKVQVEWLKTNPPPWSYATARYFGIHAFHFVAADGTKKPVRLHFDPVDGVRGLTDEEIAAAPPNFLQQRLVERNAKGAIKWNVVATLGEAGDPLDDATKLWPAERKTVQLGVLSLNHVDATNGGACAGINFDPTVLGKGIEAGPDPILAARAPTYAVSWASRKAGL